jgi:hypothetical protein
VTRLRLYQATPTPSAEPRTPRSSRVFDVVQDMLCFFGFVVRGVWWVLIAQNMSRRNSRVLKILAMTTRYREHSINATKRFDYGALCSRSGVQVCDFVPNRPHTSQTSRLGSVFVASGLFTVLSNYSAVFLCMRAVSRQATCLGTRRSTYVAVNDSLTIR